MVSVVEIKRKRKEAIIDIGMVVQSIVLKETTIIALERSSHEYLLKPMGSKDGVDEIGARRGEANSLVDLGDRCYQLNGTTYQLVGARRS